MPRRVHVFAPSRLHFGLLSPGWGDRRFGGVGAMVDAPGLRLTLRSSSSRVADGPLARRAMHFASRWAETVGQPVACHLEVESAPPEHVGLGVGTQLGLAVAAGLNAFYGLPSASALELACSVGRGDRSAVGAHGFVMGGLIVEQGKLAHEPISPLDCRIDLPADWRFLLVRPEGLHGLSGAEEACAFPDATQELRGVCDELRGLASEQLIPAAATGDFEAFASCLFEYGYRAGLCFAGRQGGAYNGPVLSNLVECIRSVGGVGVGQTSWGPTLFVVCPDRASAEALEARIAASWKEPSLVFTTAAPWNRPAAIHVVDDAAF